MAWPLIAAAAISAAASLKNAYDSNQASKRNARTNAAAALQAQQAYQQAYDQAYGEGSYNQQMQALGLQAAQDYNNLVNNTKAWDEYINGSRAYQAPEDFSFTQEDLLKDPSYQFRLQQGQNALAQNQVAGGLNLSGAAAKQMNDYTQNVASQEYANAYNRANSQYNADRNFDYTAWLNEANQYYNNLRTQLNGYNTQASNGVNASNAQALALNSLADSNSNLYAQNASATNSINNSNNAADNAYASSLAKLASLALTEYAKSGKGADSLNDNSSGNSNSNSNGNGFNENTNEGIKIANAFLNNNPYIGNLSNY